MYHVYIMDFLCYNSKARFYNEQGFDKIKKMIFVESSKGVVR